jgi:hypothetical protein
MNFATAKMHGLGETRRVAFDAKPINASATVSNFLVELRLMKS